jgi:hypothetical protein
MAKKARTPKRQKRDRVRLLKGAARIAEYIYGDDVDATQIRGIYTMQERLGLFNWHGCLCGLRDVIDRKIAEAARDGA